MKQPLLSTLCLLVSVACQPAGPAGGFDRQAVADSAKMMLEEYHQAVNENGLTGEFPYLDASPDFFWAPPGYTSALSYDSVRSILEANASLFSSIDFHWDTLQVFPLSETLATYTGIVGGTMIDTAGNRTLVSIIESGVLIKREDGWKLLSGQSAALTPAGR